MHWINKIIDFDLKFTVKARIVVPVILLIIFSLILLRTSNVEKSYLFISQLKWVLLGVVLFFITFYIKIDFLYKNSNIFYLFIILLFIITMF